jgi:hypothetical protein
MESSWALAEGLAQSDINPKEERPPRPFGQDGRSIR